MSKIHVAQQQETQEKILLFRAEVVAVAIKEKKNKNQDPTGPTHRR